MNPVLTRILRERAHFLAMPDTARLLTVSYQLRSIAYPLLSIFTGAFIWRTDNDVTSLILYYLGSFIALPFMFMLNRRLLASVSLRRLYLAGTLISGLGPLLVIFQRWNSLPAYFVYGLVYGIGSGLYWANRNFLTIRHTKSEFRSYFTGLQFTLGTISSMVVPVLAGWLIVLSPWGYQLLGVTAFILLTLSGLVTKAGTFEQPDLTYGDGRALSPAWRKARLLSVAIGCVDSVIYILPTVLILYAVGNEAVLGMMSSVVSLLTAGASYVVGRKYRHSMYAAVFTASLAGFVLSGIPLMVGITATTVSLYLLISTIADSIVWIANEPVLMDMMDDEVKRSKTTLSRLILEREWCINAGRILMLLIFLVSVALWPAHAFGIIATACGVIALAIGAPALRKA